MQRLFPVWVHQALQLVGEGSNDQIDAGMCLRLAHRTTVLLMLSCSQRCAVAWQFMPFCHLGVPTRLQCSHRATAQAGLLTWLCLHALQETHKFESRYLDGLIGPYPQVLSAGRRCTAIVALA